MLINVTQEDIDKGYLADANLCPVARAIRRATHRRDIAVWSDIIEIYKDGYSAPTPKAASEFVKLFDSESPVKPFSFELEGYQRKGGK